MSIEVDDRGVSPKLANAFLLIVNEFVANSVKHAFAERPGAIDIRIAIGAKDWEIHCKDNGTAGAREAELAAHGKGLGTRVIGLTAISIGSTARWKADGDGMSLNMRGPVLLAST